MVFVINLKSKLDWLQGSIQDTVLGMLRMLKIRSSILAADGICWRVNLVYSWIFEIYGGEFLGY